VQVAWWSNFLYRFLLFCHLIPLSYHHIAYVVCPLIHVLKTTKAVIPTYFSYPSSLEKKESGTRQAGLLLTHFG